MNRKTICLIVMAGFAVSVIPSLQAQDDKAVSLIQQSISAAGGNDRWMQNAYLVVHETQSRHEEGDIVDVQLVHYMSTNNTGYRIELSIDGDEYVYGWDGSDFWATQNGDPGDHELVREARRVISDAYFRFSLPFILDDEAWQPEYTGQDTLEGSTTEVIRVAYDNGPADRYFSGGDDHGETESHRSADNSGSSGGHHGHGEVYFFHIDDQNRIAKVYFSHHGDGTYETLLYRDYRPVDGIMMEHERILLRHDGQIHYHSIFNSVSFTESIDRSKFLKP